MIKSGNLKKIFVRNIEQPRLEGSKEKESEQTFYIYLDEKNGLYYDNEGNNIEFVGYEKDF